ncbi:MAG: DUF72 domain-containing protein [Candidatus Thorarchaeota archaeon]
MPQIKIGTAGWDYKDWIGTFYPKFLDKSQHLEYYSRYFDIVEINSTFYNIPSTTMVENWNNRVPIYFRFIIKVWQNITHNLDDPELESFITSFFFRLAPLRDKITAFLLQFPPWFKFTDNHFRKLKSLLNDIPSENRYIIELRDNTWFKPQILSRIISNKDFILGTTYKPDLKSYYYQDQKNYYIRLIGDRALTVFNRIQRKQTRSIKELNQKINQLMNSKDIHEIFIIVNNHFAGFAPTSANELKKMFQLPIRTFNTQKSLYDYLH